MAAAATRGGTTLAAEEARLARAAAGGDGGAFATLYERYERRAYNLAYRLSGSEADAAEATQEAFLSVMRRLPKLQGRDLAFGSYLFTATRNACYDLMEKRRRARPSAAIPETATPVGAGAGGAAPDPGDPEDDPDRRLLLEAQQEEVREASMRLPERQREALALRELEELSYDEIAAVMEMNRNSVAQLISRARINLRDELRGTALASVVASSPDCERALPLIAMRDDGQLDAGSEDGGWLDAHLAGCERCKLGVEAMQEAGASYRAWAPIAAAPWLLEQTMAKAAEQAGADWGEAIDEALASRAAPGSSPGMPPAYGRVPPRGGSPARRRRTVAAAGVAALLLGGGVATVLAGGDPPPVPDRPAAATQAATSTPPPAASPTPKKEDGSRPAGSAPRRQKATASRPAPAEASPAAVPAPQPQAEAGGSRPGEPPRPADRDGASRLEPTRVPATPKPERKPQPPAAPPAAPAPPSQVAPAPDPPVESPEPPDRPPTEDPPREWEPREPPAGAPPPPRIGPPPRGGRVP